MLMATIKAVLNNFEKLDIADVARKSIDQTKETIVELNRDQLFAGKRSDGSEIKPAYSGFTINEKEKKGQPFDRVTLKDEGSFYAGINVKVEGDKIIENSSDEKNDELFGKYATTRGNLFGLSTPYKKEYLDEKLRPAFRGNIKAVTGL
jgi:hypothetical protein